MPHRPLTARLAIGFLGLAALAACSDVTDPDAISPADPVLASSGPVLVECPVEYEISATGRLGATGGAIVLEKHRMALPSLAVVTPTEFRVAARASNYMELEIRAGQAESFNFRKPVTVTIDYSRCSRTNIDKAPLTVWQIDPDTKALLENMGGVDDKENRTVTFTTDHLSTFSIAQ